jgi:hypothetical protein
MRSPIRFLPLTLLAGCANACAIGKALYIAVVHDSGAPAKSEIARIDVREGVFLRDVRRARIAVLPVTVLGRSAHANSDAADTLAAALRALGAHTVIEAPIELPYQPQPNEAYTLWTRFRALGDSVRVHPRADADYVLLVDVMGTPERRSIGAVHAMAVTAAGALAYRRLWNSHQPLFKELAPRSLDDAVRMVATDVSRAAAK